ncbi:hypothetical protein [Proteiniclasticum ruminis]|uniref:Uncharacterized protein n=1 Tax=Proteiniclasticum ruminis TaxID=398199 RepID=A0A1I5EP31_9CLOT|nr:hypothetical protein [Proteiniclasticum ruminis]SFO13262.1 hypothetical protein SAMN04488695_1199 [Proteiniclasticum ruminis]
MKKIFALVLSSVLALSVFAGCAKTEEPAETPAETPVETPAEEPGEEEPAEEAGAIVKVGLGIKTSIGKSKDLTDGAATGQVDSVIVAAGFDKDGKIVSVTIDTAQDKVGFDGEMKLTSDTAVEGKSKLELGDAYGMKGASGIGKEWNEQIEAFGAWMIGKTVEEVKALELVDDVTTNEELTSSVTIKLGGYISALEEAYANAVEVEGAEKVGLGIVTSIAKSKSMEGETMAVAQVDTTVVATALKADGVIAGTVIDVAQTKVEFDKDGKVASDKAAEVKSKAELGDAYGMKGASGIGKEWFEQALSLSEYMVGKTVADVTGMELAENVPTSEDLTSSVTIKVNGYLAALDKAGKNAR